MKSLFGLYPLKFNNATAVELSFVVRSQRWILGLGWFWRFEFEGGGVRENGEALEIKLCLVMKLSKL
jgi:hypothetical protein